MCLEDSVLITVSMQNCSTWYSNTTGRSGYPFGSYGARQRQQFFSEYFSKGGKCPPPPPHTHPPTPKKTPMIIFFFFLGLPVGEMFCSAHLYWSMIHLYNNGLGDYSTPLLELLLQLRAALKKGKP